MTSLLRQHSPAAAGWAGTGVQSETQGDCAADAPGVGPGLRVDLPAPAAGPVWALGAGPGHAATPCRRTWPVQVSTAVTAEGWPLVLDASPGISPMLFPHPALDHVSCNIWNRHCACWAVPDSCLQAFVHLRDASLHARKVSGSHCVQRKHSMRLLCSPGLLLFEWCCGCRSESSDF